MKLVLNNSKIVFKKTSLFKVGEWDYTFTKTINTSWATLSAGEYVAIINSAQGGYFTFASGAGVELLKIPSSQFGIPKEFSLSEETSIKLQLGEVGDYNIILYRKANLIKIGEIVFASKYLGDGRMSSASQNLPDGVSSESEIYTEWVCENDKFAIPLNVGIISDGSWLSRAGQNSILRYAGNIFAGKTSVNMQTSISVGGGTDGDATFVMSFYKEINKQ